MITNQEHKTYIQELLISIHANIRDLRGKKAFADAEELDYIEGRLFSYQEMLEIMIFTARQMDLDKNELGI